MPLSAESKLGALSLPRGAQLSFVRPATRTHLRNAFDFFPGAAEPHMKVLRFYAEDPREIFDGNTGSVCFLERCQECILQRSASRTGLRFSLLELCFRSFHFGLLARTALDFRILRRVRVDGMAGSDT